MKMKTKYSIGISFLVLCICLCGCSKNDEIEKSNDGFSFLIAPPLSLEVVDTKATVVLGEIDINDVWILQFSESNDNNLLKGIYITGEKISKMDGKKDLLIKLNTDEAGFSELKSNFYIIANGGSSLFSSNEVKAEGGGTLTEAVMKSKTIAFTFPFDTNTLQTTQPALLTSGPIVYTPTSDKKIVVVSRMFRAFSKISATVNFTGKGAFTPTKISVCNIPTVMALFEAGGEETSFYPSTNGNIDTNDRTYNFSWSNKSTRPMIFYMPENLRGSGLGKKQQDKGVVTNGPTIVDGNRTLKNCTYLTVEGDYKYDASHSGSIKVKYRFYLGGNFIDDYNIYRDYWYKLTINITGANSADLRVTIIDGNVAVFDEVQTITNEVDF